MAEIGRITLSEIALVEIDSDPTIIGIEANTGSLAFMTDGTAIYHKSGTGDTQWTRLDKSYIGLPNVDNTSDANKPISSSTQSSLDLKAPLASPTFTGTVSGITKSMVGLANVDNTSDANKPISTATQTALNGKQATGNYITGLTGDVTASGPGSVVATLSNTGITEADYCQLAVDAKGRATSGKRAFTVILGGAQSRTVNTYATITGMTTAGLPVGLYKINVYGLYQTAATTTGIGLRLSVGTATISGLSITWNFQQGASGTDQHFSYSQTATGDNVTSAYVVAANTNYTFSGDGVFRVTATGTVVLQFRSETNGSSVTVQPDVVVLITEL